MTDHPALGRSRRTNSALVDSVTPVSATTFCWIRRRWTAWPVLERPLLTTTTAVCLRAAVWSRRLWIQRGPTSRTTAVRMESLRLLLSFRTSSSVSYKIIGTDNTSQVLQTCSMRSWILTTFTTLADVLYEIMNTDNIHNSRRRVVWDHRHWQHSQLLQTSCVRSSVLTTRHKSFRRVVLDHRYWKYSQLFQTCSVR